MFVLGLTGGIATGKSTVAGMLEKLGAYRVDADRLAREVVEPGRPAWRSIVEYFGPGVLYDDRTLNRHALAAVIFEDAAERRKLEEMTHPPILKRIREEVEQARNTGVCVVLLEVPLLYEAGLDSETDKVLVVVTDEKTQLDRMMRRDNISEVEARQRIAAQMSLAEKAKHADYIVYNGGTQDETKVQVKNLWQELIQECLDETKV